MKNKKTILAIIGVIAIILVTIGITYAYWLVTKTQTGSNVITAGCLDITLNGESNDINLTNQFPISDEEGMELTPYEFTVTNNCNTAVDYHINLESIGTESTAIKATALKAVLDDAEPKILYDYVGADTTISGAYEAYTLGYGTLAAASDTSTDDSVTYELRIWIDADAPISEMNKTFASKISVAIGQGISTQGGSLASLILADAEENNYLKTEMPDFTTGAGNGLYSTADNDGTSYYFRGVNLNNYVKLGTWKEEINYGVSGCYSELGNLASCVVSFDTMEECEAVAGPDNEIKMCKEMIYGKPNGDMYWRIVRINGDGTIRLAYDGMTAEQDGNYIYHFSTIGSVNFYSNGTTGINRVSYTYDDGTGTQVNSNAKTKIDNWYKTNLEDDYGKYIADTIFCNNREKNSDGEFVTYVNLVRAKTPSLMCNQKEDRYTVNNEKGNKYLTYPVGMLTIDEVIFSGLDTEGIQQHDFYLSPGGNGEMTMSPADESIMFGVAFDSFLYTTSSDEIRPVINLKADVLFEGSGTTTDPYVIAS